MFQSRKTQAQNIRLPQLSDTPSFGDMQYLLNEAQRNKGRVVEMPFTTSDRSQAFMLSVSCPADGSDPIWSLYRGTKGEFELSWSYPSGDVQLIHSIVNSETGSGLQEAIDSGTYVSAPKRSEDNVAPAAGEAPSASSTQEIALKSILEGDLKNMQVPNLLQSITMSKMTGRLHVRANEQTAKVYFDQGTAVDAAIGDVRGDEAVLELITWEEGKFHFIPDERTSERSVRKRLDLLLMEGVALLDQTRYLAAAKIRLDSYLLRKNVHLSEADFEQAVSRGAPLDLVVQKRFYQLIDNRSTLLEILRKRPMGKIDWVPIVFNLVSTGIVTVTDTPPQSAQKMPLEAIGIDQSAIQAVLRSLQRPETGIFTFPALLFFVEQEYLRCESYGWPFSMLVIEMRVLRSANSPPEPLSSSQEKEVLRRVAATKKSLDILGHFETFDYALVLPNTDIQAACMVAQRLCDVLLRNPLDNTGGRLLLHLGIASMPKDAHELGLFIAAAREAKNRARLTGTPILCFKDIS